ncbi:MAG TPA: class I SAM-dependent methyltransferase [Nitrososphaeraceae archaeon]|nr:class I SAM-dependent methyltransferase [Nitrososphaeraceae archaeon]
MELVKRNCPVCASELHKDLYKKKIYTREFKDHGPAAVKCKKCHMVYLNPVMSQDEYNKFYNENKQLEFVKSHIKNYDQQVWKETQRRVKIVRKIAKNFNMSLLDVGCGYGHFIEAISYYIFYVYGLDINKDRVLNSVNKGLKIFANDILTFDYSKQFDIITMFHSLEHMLDCKGVAQKAHNLLKNEGLFVVEIPNINDILLKIPTYKRFYFQNAHCSYFNLDTLNKLILPEGFVLKKVIPTQRYSLSNHLHWLFKRKPGNFKILRFLDRIYAKFLRKTKYYDTIVAIYKKEQK